MSKLKLIIAREYMSMVGRKSFIIMTILIPILMIACILLPIGIGYLNHEGSDVENVAVIDETGRYGGGIEDTDLFHFVPLRGDTIGNAREFYDNAGESLTAMVIIPADIDSLHQVTIYSDKTINSSLKMSLMRQLSDTITRAHVASYGVPNLQQMIDESSVNVDVKSVKWGDDGSETETSTEIAMGIGFVLAFLIYMFVLMYGAMIMNGVIEEKTNRIVEVIVSSCKPFQLMMGKIIGVALVGLTQLAIWVVVMLALSAVAGGMLGLAVGDTFALGNDPAALEAALAQGGNADMSGIVQAILSVNYLQIFTSFVFYFIGGYLLYAALFAAFGSAVDQAADASQFTTPIIIIMIIALYAGMACIENPNGPMAFWCSMIPFTSPIVMMVRLPYDVPLWQLALSILLLFATAALMVWVAARIYRTGILLYGKKTSYRDIFSWLKR